MKKVLSNKIFIFFLIFALLFIFYITLSVKTDNTNPLYLFGLTILYFYLLLVLSFFIEIIIFKILKFKPIKYLIIYPFSFDGKWSFRPGQLLPRQELYRDSFYLNLYDKKYSKDLKKDFIRFNSIRQLSLFFSVMFLYYLITLAFNVIIVYESLIIFFLSLVINFIKYSYDHCGIGYIILFENVHDYFYTGKCIREMKMADYEKWLALSINNDVDKAKILTVLNNYIYRSFLETDKTLKLDLINKVIDIVQNYQTFDVIRDVTIQNIIKFIGIQGVKLENTEYISFSKKKTNNFIVNTLQIGFSFSSYTIKKPQEFIDYLNDDKTINLDKHLVLGKSAIFSCLTNIEDEILNLEFY